MPSATLPGRLIAVVLLSACLAFSQTTPTKKTTASPTATKRAPAKDAKVSAASSSTHGRTAVASNKEAAGGSARVRTRKVVVTRKLVHGRWVRTTQIVHADPGPTYQAHPDPERYQQIQQALAEKGYFKGEANGQWGDDSVAALKQFQTERNIPNDGKISALSLIGLGLGPNRETAAVKTNPTPPVAQADPTIH